MVVPGSSSSRPTGQYNVSGPSGSSLPHFGGNAPGAVGLMINENTSHGDEDEMSDENGTESQLSPGQAHNMILHQ